MNHYKKSLILFFNANLKLNLVSYLSPNFSICVDVNPITIFLMYEDQKELMNTESFKIQLNSNLTKLQMEKFLFNIIKLSLP